MLIGYEQSISPVYGIFDENMPMKDILEYFVHASLICLTLRHDAEAMKVLKMGLCIPFTKVDEQVLLLYRRYILTSLIVTGQPPSPIPFISEDNAKILQNKSSFIHPIVECFVTFPSTSSSSSTPSSSSLSEATPLSLFNEDQLSAVILSNEKELRDAGVLSLARRCIQALKEINFKRIIQAYGAMPLNSLASATNRSVSDSIRYLLLLASQSKLQLSIDEKRGTVTFAEGLTSDETNESSKMDEDRSSMKMSQGSEQKFSSSYEKRKEMELAISFAEQMNKIGQIAQQLGFTDDALSLSSFLISRF
ncbi:uncharacterized protein MONOS_4625 [Monocercomonoides exilis]|uniref:uncharacterized protein n=1 Tax=Monocercomonoides exilis TaxID=2049356 RepID=UPI00355A7655|nr:hypothetical protein MONOS_4625 [Monocercomonoides exilis]|eukprot:MONOS_4625.1-p1 / transcript=MONOS_4625.1 / gene=MONOS_4625 / organism=Monocercomonoides_exilis_PA203 / gene_product=unspecified product / transcript_product=unspecified product / location=Mono_scaffold00125:11909-13369(-) / protein_length=307 / sequence_SO=supercontig / SO=protein_coding / is_pseudo=false